MKINNVENNSFNEDVQKIPKLLEKNIIQNNFKNNIVLLIQNEKNDIKI